MKISGEQIGAALVLSGMKREQVAEYADISLTTFSSIVNGHSGGHASTIARIHKFFDVNGIEFIEDGQAWKNLQTAEGDWNI